MTHPDHLEAGEVTDIYKYISNKLIGLGFELRSEGTYQAKQIFLNGIANPVGAIQYEGSNDFEKKLPFILSLRFNRANVPEQWKVQLEKDDKRYRKILKTVITHKFKSFNEETKSYIDDLCSTLGDSRK